MNTSPHSSLGISIGTKMETEGEEERKDKREDFPPLVSWAGMTVSRLCPHGLEKTTDKREMRTEQGKEQKRSAEKIIR